MAITKKIWAIFLLGMVCQAGIEASTYIRIWRSLGCYKEGTVEPEFKIYLGEFKKPPNLRFMFHFCRKRAESEKLFYFGIQNENQCWGSNGALTTRYDKYGCSKNCLVDKIVSNGVWTYGVGKGLTNFVYHHMPVLTSCRCGQTKRYKLDLAKDIRPGCPVYNRKIIRVPNSGSYCRGAHATFCPGWRPLGCYKDTKNRALKYFLGYAKKHKSILKVVEDCQQKAKWQKLDYLGIQNRFECWGSDDEHAYRKYGCSRNCETTSVIKGKTYGVGRARTNFVYQRKRVYTLCRCGIAKRYRLSIISDTRRYCPLYNKIVLRGTLVRDCPIHTQRCPVDGPWSPCDRLCSKGGKQKRFRVCTIPGGKTCVGFAIEYRDCNSKNCPQPCSFEGALVQLLNVLRLGIKINNHMITTFSQIMNQKDNAGSTTSNTHPSNDFLIQTIKTSVNGNTDDKLKHARTLLGLLLARQRDCHYVKIAQEIKTKIGYHGYRRLINVNGKVTLTFVLDTSGSMKSMIDVAAEIAKNLAGYPSISDVDYVLSTFTEDDSKPKGHTLVGNVQKFNNLNAFVGALMVVSSQIKQGLNDCSTEMLVPTFAGIIRGISEGNPKPGSPMFVFTNSPPKSFGQYTRDSAIYYAQKNRIPVNVFLSMPACLHRMSSYIYKAITSATGGFALSFESVLSMNSLGRLITGSLDGTSIVVSEQQKAIQEKRAISKFNGGFDIDDIAQEGTLEISAEKDAGPSILLLNPNQTPRHHREQIQRNLFWTIPSPIQGRWNFEPKIASVRFDVKSQAKLDITMEWTFMRKGTPIAHNHPLIGEKAKVVIKIPNISRLQKSTLSFKLPDNWRFLSNKEDSYIFESIKALDKTDRFKAVLRGKTLSNVYFTRETVVIRPKMAAIRSLMAAWYCPLSNAKFIYKASLDYPGPKPKKFKINVTTKHDSGGEWSAQSKKEVEVSCDGTTISQILSAPSSGSTLNVKITLQSGEDEIIFENNPFLVV